MEGLGLPLKAEARSLWVGDCPCASSDGALRIRAKPPTGKAGLWSGFRFRARTNGFKSPNHQSEAPAAGDLKF